MTGALAPMVARTNARLVVSLLRAVVPAVLVAVSPPLCAQTVPQSTVPERNDADQARPPAAEIHDQQVVAPVSPAGVSIGMNFEGADAGDSTFYPPDTMGAIGPAHFVELINGRYSVFDRTSGLVVQSSTLNQFWANAGAPPQGSYSFDPRVLFDEASGRWFACAADAARTTYSGILVAVSNSSDPTAGWIGFRVDADTDNQQWADFPTMGINADGLYVSANMYPVAAGTLEQNFWVFPKGDLVNGSIANMTALEGPYIPETGTSLQLAIDLDGGGLPAPILSGSGFTVLRSDLIGPVTAPSIAQGPVIDVPGYAIPPDADQPGPKPDINTLDSRFGSNVVLQGGNIWAVQSIGVGGRSALRWFRIDPDTSAVLDEGVLSDPALAFFFPSIAVNEYGDIVIGCSGTSPTQYVSTYAFVGQHNPTGTTFSAPLLLRAGVSDYQRLDGYGRNRWGDYSATTLDPNDHHHFWTIQEFVAGTNFWSTQITEIIISSCECDDDGDPCNGIEFCDHGVCISAPIDDCNNNGIEDSCDVADGPDCNQNAVPDECDIASGLAGDCNGNGVPDSCDIASAFADDCNGNGVPDDCDIASGLANDCNGNGVPDGCDIDQGLVPDCNGNGRPDHCDVSVPFAFTDQSGPLSPVGFGTNQVHTVVDAPMALTDVTLSFAARADLSEANERIAVYLESTLVGFVFQSATDCPAGFDQDELVVTASAWNTARSGGSGDVDIRMTPSSTVGSAECLNSSVSLTVSCAGAMVSNDLNGNDIPDECESGVPCSEADLTTLDAGIGDPDYGVPDGVVSAVDLQYFVNAWVAGDLTIADLTTQNAPAGDPLYGVPDGLVTAVDIQFYVNLWLIGCP